MDMFAIRLDPAPSRIGRVTIGDFSESFEVTDCCWSRADYESSWSVALNRLVDGEQSAVALMVARCEPPASGAQRAWVLYRAGEAVFVQDRIWIAGEHDAEFDAGGQMIHIATRERLTEDGNPISEWATSVRAIEAFIRDAGEPSN